MAINQQGPLVLEGVTATTAQLVVPNNPSQTQYGVVYVEGTGTIASGVVTIEEAAAPDYGGTWSVLSTVTGSVISGGACQAVHFPGVYGAIRVRVSTTIAGGGSVTFRVLTA